MKTHQNRPNPASRESLIVLSTLLAAGGAGAQDTSSAPAETSVETNTLPPQVVEGAAPAPRPVPRPTPAPAPEPVAPAPVIEVPAPVIDDSLYNADTLSSPKFTQPLLDTPRSVQVIPEQLMEDQGATTLRDALRNVSGISIQAGEGGGVPGDNLSIRGFSARNDLFIDGVRDFGAYSRDPFNLEQVEVVKGPGSSYSGRGSTGGSVNLVSKTAKLNDFLNTDVSVGTDNLRRGTLDFNTALPIDGAAFRLNVMGQENDTPGRDHVSNERWGVAGSLAFGLGEVVGGEPSGKSTYDKNGISGKETAAVVVPNDTRLYLNFFHLEEDNVPDFGIPWVPDTITDPALVPYINDLAPVSYRNFYGNLRRDTEQTATTVGTVRFEHDLNDSMTFRNQTRVGQTDRYFIMTPPRFVTGSNPAMIRGDNWRNRDERNSIVANQTDLMFSFETGGLEHDAIVGFEYVREEFDRYPFSVPNTADIDLYEPQNAFAPFVPGTPVGSTGDSTHSLATTQATYLFDTVEVNEWLEVSGGARYDRYDLSYTSVDLTGGTGTTRLGRVDEVVSGQAAVVLKPQENGSVYFGWGTSFNPSGEAMSLSDSTTANNSINLDPEVNETLELGTKWNLFEEQLSLSAALFQTTKTNARTQDPADPNDFTVLEGEQEVKGVEFGVSGRVTPWWQIYTSFTHLESEITKSLNPLEVGNEIAHTPENTFSLWNHFDLPGKFFAGGGPVFVDSRFSNNENLRVAPSYTTWDAMVGYEINENLTFRVNFFNLGDEDYIDRVGGGHAIPGAGRSVRFTISGQF
ncbi:MAG: TonB-dependent siderophore receptor [Verrucomicrobiae bacterium]|nr:TonB-dependent siderophore receptor [Verrucomicrobiae bacterium]